MSEKKLSNYNKLYGCVKFLAHRTAKNFTHPTPDSELTIVLNNDMLYSLYESYFIGIYTIEIWKKKIQKHQLQLVLWEVQHQVRQLSQML